MEVNVIIFYIGILLIVALVLLLIALVILYLRSANNLQKLKEEKETNWRAQMSSAQATVKKVIEDAHTNAGQIVGSAEIFKKEQIDKVNIEINKAITHYTENYNRVLVNLQNEMVNVLKNTPKDIQVGVVKQLQILRDTLQKDLATSRKDVSDLIEKEYTKMHNDLESYKQAKVAQLDKSIFKIIQYVSRRVLTKEINAEEHEKLVIKALEEAKRQEMIKTEIVDTDSNQPVNTKQELGKNSQVNTPKPQI